jgi:hypothetical protein
MASTELMLASPMLIPKLHFKEAEKDQREQSSEGEPAESV